MTLKFPVTRDMAYAHIVTLDPTLSISAKALLAEAFRSGQLPESYIEVDIRRRGSALNYDLFDFAINRAGRVVGAIFQQRFAICTKYGFSPTKDYYLITAGRGKAVSVKEIPNAKPRLVRYARFAWLAGELIDAISGKPSVDMQFRIGDQKSRATIIHKVSDQCLAKCMKYPERQNESENEILRRILAGADMDTFGNLSEKISSAIFARQLVATASITTIEKSERARPSPIII